LKVPLEIGGSPHSLVSLSLRSGLFSTDALSAMAKHEPSLLAQFWVQSSPSIYLFPTVDKIVVTTGS